MTAGGLTTGHDPAAGRERWRLGGYGNGQASLAWSGDRLFVGGGKGGPLACVRAGAEGDVSKSLVWKRTTGGPGMSTPVAASGHYFALVEGKLWCLDAATGEERFRERVPKAGQTVASLAAVGDALLLVDENGVVSAVRAGAEFEPLASLRLPEGTWATPLVTPWAVYVRTKTKLVCLRPGA